MYRLLVILLMTSPELIAQSESFQGQINYQHFYNFTRTGKDSMKVLGNLGTSSKYITRHGFYKWVFDDGYLGEEYYSSAEGKAYNRYPGNDTLFFTKGSGDDTLLSYEIYLNADTICGYTCNRIKVVTGSKRRKDAFVIRIISYSRDLPVNPDDFILSDNYCNYEVYKITRSIPLRIEIESSDWPYSMCYYATKVDHRPVTVKEVELPADMIRKEN